MTPSVHSVVYLALARSHLALGDEAGALESLEELNRIALDYPRTWGVACLLLPTFSAQAIEGNPRLASLARELAVRAGSNSIFEDRSSAVCFAAQGASEYLRGRFQEAVPLFQRALEERRRWPEAIRAHRWPEDARDRYYLALVHAALAEEESAEVADKALTLAHESYEAAEAAYREGPLYPEDADLLGRVRDKAREVLGKREPGPERPR